MIAKSRIKSVLLVVAILVTATGAWAEENDFNTLLEESTLRFTLPEGWIPSTNSYHSLQADSVFVTPDGAAEMHVLIRPLGRIKIDYDDPHGSAPNPNEMFPLLFQSMTETLSDHTDTKNQEYRTPDAIKQYNADWAAASVFNVKDEISNIYEQGLVLAIHRHKKADAYIIFLSNDLSSVKEAVTAGRKSLWFIDEE